MFDPNKLINMKNNYCSFMTWPVIRTVVRLPNLPAPAPETRDLLETKRSILRKLRTRIDREQSLCS